MWDQTDSPETPDRGETSEKPRPPFSGTQTHKVWSTLTLMTLPKKKKGGLLAKSRQR